MDFPDFVVVDFVVFVVVDVVVVVVVIVVVVVVVINRYITFALHGLCLQLFLQYHYNFTKLKVFKTYLLPLL